MSTTRSSARLKRRSNIENEPASHQPNTNISLHLLSQSPSLRSSRVAHRQSVGDGRVLKSSQSSHASSAKLRRLAGKENQENGSRTVASNLIVDRNRTSLVATDVENPSTECVSQSQSHSAKQRTLAPRRLSKRLAVLTSANKPSISDNSPSSSSSLPPQFSRCGLKEPAPIPQASQFNSPSSNSSISSINTQNTAQCILPAKSQQSPFSTVTCHDVLTASRDVVTSSSRNTVEAAVTLGDVTNVRRSRRQKAPTRFYTGRKHCDVTSVDVSDASSTASRNLTDRRRKDRPPCRVYGRGRSSVAPGPSTSSGIRDNIASISAPLIGDNCDALDEILSTTDVAPRRRKNQPHCRPTEAEVDAWIKSVNSHFDELDEFELVVE